MKTHSLTMPSFWASYLINGDDSGLTASEKRACDSYCDANGVTNVLDVDEPFFSWYYDFHGGDAKGGDLARYTVTLSRSPRPKVQTK
jgi:hypothetical protein